MGTDPEELDEKNFIQEHGSKFVWFFLILFLLISALFWGINMWQRHLEKTKLTSSPFYQVTNRDFSLFLWQNPPFMRKEAALSEGYLTHFRTRGEVHMVPELADTDVAAPADVLYRYHTWRRLVAASSLSDRPIYREIFLVFLEENPEWLPKFWAGAPKEYQKLVHGLLKSEVDDLQSLPFEVRLAYQGWLNYTREGEKIALFSPTKDQIARFLKKHPHYGQSYWRNLIPGYLEEGKELPYFFKSALFNSGQ